jgi:mono/diheme cytochrome c family protein
MNRRRTSRLAVVVLVLMTTPSACRVTYDDHGRARVARLDGDTLAVGRDAYDTACASCHGRDAHGHGPAAPALRVPPADLTGLSDRDGGTFPRERVLAMVTGTLVIDAHGSREMPVWGARFVPNGSGAEAAAAIYTQHWLEALAAYLETLQRPSARPAAR